jgi:hypothetical protein
VFYLYFHSLITYCTVEDMRGGIYVCHVGPGVDPVSIRTGPAAIPGSAHEALARELLLDNFNNWRCIEIESLNNYYYEIMSSIGRKEISRRVSLFESMNK